MTSLVKSGEKEGEWNVRYYAVDGHTASSTTHSLKRSDNGANKLWEVMLDSY